MFEFEPDEYIFTKFAFFFKKRKKKKEAALEHAVNLSDIKPRLSIFARAITGEPIELFEAEREGGYKNNNFFFPTKFSDFETEEENLSFYLFRILSLAIQKNLDFNWNDSAEHNTSESQQKAQETSEEVLTELFNQFPITEKYHQKFVSFYKNKATEKQSADLSF
nr:NorD protein [Mariniflexile sp.]